MLWLLPIATSYLSPGSDQTRLTRRRRAGKTGSACSANRKQEEGFASALLELNQYGCIRNTEPRHNGREIAAVIEPRTFLTARTMWYNLSGGEEADKRAQKKTHFAGARFRN